MCFLLLREGALRPQSSHTSVSHAISRLSTAAWRAALVEKPQRDSISAVIKSKITTCESPRYPGCARHLTMKNSTYASGWPVASHVLIIAMWGAAFNHLPYCYHKQFSSWHPATVSWPRWLHTAVDNLSCTSCANQEAIMVSDDITVPSERR